MVTEQVKDKLIAIWNDLEFKYEAETYEAFSMALKALDENNELWYKLNGVMHFVDKWLDGDELKLDEVQRADLAREKALKIIDETIK